jgi:alpha-N-arabinofuranosidase
MTLDETGLEHRNYLTGRILMKTEAPLKQLPRRTFLRGSAAICGLAISHQLIPYLHAEDNNPSASQAFNASISIQADTILHRLDPKIYGSMIEHLGRAVYGGIYEEGSPLSDPDGVRKDVLDAAKAWGVSIFRWPGGNFASGYHWTDGIGPKESRPRRYNIAWYEEESNHFGTHEYISYCRKLGAEPYICVNLGTGTPEEASNWVEYCNGTGNTYYANLRRKNGQDEPFNVKYWGLGNEVYGGYQIGHKDAEDYAKIALEAAKLMKWVDPDIRVVAVGFDAEWNRIVLEKLVHIVDYMSVHDYEGSPEYYESLGSIQNMERRIRETEDMIDLTDPLRLKGDPTLEWSIPKKKQRVEVAVDEWNIWYRKHDIWRREVPNPVEEVYNLRDALWVASGLNLFQRMGKVVTLATLAQLVNVLAPILTSKTGLVLQPTYFAMKLYCQECGPNYLQANVISPTFSSKSFSDIRYLDISATLDDSKKTLSLGVVNRHETQRAITKIRVEEMKVARQIDSFQIAGPADAENTFADSHIVSTVQKKAVISGDTFTYEFPPHSITMLKVQRA